MIFPRLPEPIPVQGLPYIAGRAGAILVPALVEKSKAHSHKNKGETLNTVTGIDVQRSSRRPPWSDRAPGSATANRRGQRYRPWRSREHVICYGEADKAEHWSGLPRLADVASSDRKHGTIIRARWKAHQKCLAQRQRSMASSPCSQDLQSRFSSWPVADLEGDLTLY